MRNISQGEYEKKLKKIKENNESEARFQKLKKEKNKYKSKKNKPSASKLLLLGVILLCVEIVVFSEYAMLRLGDTSAMYALIGIPVALAPTCIGYFMKSKAENTEGGIVYDAAMTELMDKLQNKPDTSSNEDGVG